MQLDHVILSVPNVDAALLVLPDLGEPAFRSSHPQLGSDNAIWLPRGGPYIEVLAGFWPGGNLLLAWNAASEAEVAAAVDRLRAAGAPVGDPQSSFGTSPDGRAREWTYGVVSDRSLLGGAIAIVIAHTGWDWRAELAQPTPIQQVGQVVITAPDPVTTRALLDTVLDGVPDDVEILPGAAVDVARIDIVTDAGTVEFRLP